MPPAVNLRNAKSIFSTVYFDLYTQILFLTITIYLLYYLIRFIVTTLSRKNCRHGCRYIISEGFATNFETSKDYFTTLSKKCDVITEKIGSMSGSVDDLQNRLGGLMKDICYVTLQVDEALAGNYASNVPEEEQSYPIEEQKKRADKRKVDSVKYVANLKKSFVETHNNIPLLECFNSSGMTDDETAQLAGMRDNLNAKIDETNSNLDQFDNSMITLQKEFAKERLQRYYTTLNYNDKYIKQMNRATAAAQSGEEGFANQDDPNEVLDFKPPKKQVDKQDPEANPAKRVNDLEEHYANSEAMFYKLLKTFNTYNNTAKKQTQQLKQAKAIVTDKDEQNRQMNANTSKAVKSS